MNQQPIKKQTQHNKSESIFTMLLLILCAFLLVFACVTVTQSCTEAEPQETGTGSTVTTTNPPEPDDPEIDPDLLDPVFANGVVPTVLPVSNVETVELTGELTSAYAVIIGTKNNTVLAGKGADTPMAPASMTKVMTLIVACEKLTQYDLTQRLTLNEYYNSYDYNGLDVSLIDGTK